MKILTWNVLHRVHAERHSEPAIQGWPDETKRVRGVATRVAKALTEEGVDVVLLQEVSGDVLAELRARFPDRAVLNHLYPRVPRAKPSVRDPSEHLVIVAPPGSKVLRAHTFANDPGKGFLMVGLPGGAVVLSTHVSWGRNGEPQLSLLAQVVREHAGVLCVGGDFNAEREVISKALGVSIAPLPEGSSRTRPHEDGGSDIDHLLCRGAVLGDVRVLEHEDLSDHRPVVGTLA
ncbi:MAG: endonuclease/exonuclease/phosphatase family protein [Archangium sp.]|nr:endonuclease/exonuclease/phosphatase family protein [Archangium sp.]